MKLQLLTLNSKGYRKVIGIFEFNKTIKFKFISGDYMTDEEFIANFHNKYYIDGKEISLDNPKQYFDNLKFRFSGRTWIES